MNAEDMNKEPRGVGGWLLFFCFALVALGPPGTLENLHKMWEHLQSGVFPVVRQIAILETVGALLITVYGIVVGILIWRGSQRGRNLARQYLVIVFRDWDLFDLVDILHLLAARPKYIRSIRKLRRLNCKLEMTSRTRQIQHWRAM